MMEFNFFSSSDSAYIRTKGSVPDILSTIQEPSERKNLTPSCLSIDVIESPEIDSAEILLIFADKDFIDSDEIFLSILL